MKRLLASLAALAAVVTAAPAAGAPEPGSNASCQGFLASYANPNNGFVIHEVVKPAAEALGVTTGALQSGVAQQHNGSLGACIP